MNIFGIASTSKYSHLTRNDDNPALQFFKVFLKSNSDYIALYVKLLCLVQIDDKQFINFKSKDDTQSDDNLGMYLLNVEGFFL